MASAIVCEQSVDCKADIASLWNIISDTDRLNRAVGNGHVKLDPKDDTSAARFIATTRLAGFAVQYDERPFEWSYLKSFRVLRPMTKGPLTALEAGFDFRPLEPSGARVTLRLTAFPRHALLTPAIRFQTRRSLNRFRKELLRVDGAIMSGAGAPPTRRGRVNHTRIAELGAAMHHRGENAELTNKLLQYVNTASDFEVARIRPFVLADAWKVDRAALLATCLGAVKAGLLGLHWELICPSCRVAAASLTSLESVGEHGLCQLCEIRFGVDLDEAVEATFSPVAKLRDIDTGTYCSGGPARTPHVLGQVVLPRDEIATLISPPEPGRYRMFVRGGATVAVTVAKGASTVEDVDLAELHEQMRIVLAPEGALRIHNGGSRELHAKIEKVEWVRQAATAAEVVTSPRFMREFGDQRLPVGQPLVLHNVAVVWARLRGVEMFAARVGLDAATELTRTIVARLASVFERFMGGVAQQYSHGIVVVFGRPLDAANAMRAAARELTRIRGQNLDANDLALLMGCAAGPIELLSSDGKQRNYRGLVVDKAEALAEAASTGALIERSEVERAIMAGRFGPSELGEELEVATPRGSVAARVVRFN